MTKKLRVLKNKAKDEALAFMRRAERYEKKGQNKEAAITYECIGALGYFEAFKKAGNLYVKACEDFDAQINSCFNGIEVKEKKSRKLARLLGERTFYKERGEDTITLYSMLKKLDNIV